jgi:dynein heavy chain
MLQVAQTQDLNPINFFGLLTRDNIVISLYLSTTLKMTDFNEVVQIYLNRFKKYSYLWEPNEETEYSTFEKLEPEIIDIQKRMEVYVELEIRIEEMEEKHRVGLILLHSEGVKQGNENKNMEIY